MKEIEVLGTGCSGCRALYETVTRVVGELGLEASVVRQENLERIIACGVMALPALVIDGEVVSTGRRLSADEVKELLTRRL